MADSIGHPELIIRNANIITIDPRRSRAQALAVRHGRFIAVGDDETVSRLAGPDTKVLNLAGKTVLPGFIDAHIHVLSSGIRHVMAADCDLPSVAAIQDALRERTQATPAGEWVQGFKFDDTKTTEGRFLYRQDLDAVTTQHPLMVTHKAGHVFYLNSRALELAGFHSETTDPPGGRFGRDSASGELNGVIYERAIEQVRFGLIPVENPRDSPPGPPAYMPDAEPSRHNQQSRCPGHPRRLGDLPGRQGQRRVDAQGLRPDVLSPLSGAAGRWRHDRSRRLHA